MAKLIVYILMLLVLMVELANVQGYGGTQYHLGWVSKNPTCNGSIAECLGGEEEEMELDSEISRRILATTKYISYGALRRNTVPCSRRGASYYNCKPGAQANPYTRGCSAITRCRS